MFYSPTSVLFTFQNIFVNIQYGNSFGIVYDDVDTFSFAGEINVDVNRNFKLGIKAEYFSYATDAQTEAWNLPDIKGSLFLDYQIDAHWFTGANLFYTGERKDQFFLNDGSITTIHANNPRDTLGRLETMVMMSGMELPSRAIREQISSAINLIVFCARMTDGTRKIMKVTEIVGMEAETITLQDLYIFNQEGFDEGGNVVGKHVPTGIVPKFMDKLKAYGETIPTSVFQAERRM